MTMPQVGRSVHFYDPKLVTRMGWLDGYAGRKEGPYAALVTNDLGKRGPELIVFAPGVAPIRVHDVRHEDDPDRKPEEAYWAFMPASRTK